MAESPRWLNRRRKYKELYSLIKTMAKMNRSKVPSDVEEKFQGILKEETESGSTETKDPEASYTNNEITIPEDTEHVKPNQLILDPVLRLYTIVMFFNWALVTLGK